MTYFNRIKELSARKPIKVGCKVSGRFRLVVRQAESGIIVQDTGWFDNLLLDYALSTGLHSSGWGFHCHIGSSSQAPAVTDTALVSWLASDQNAEEVTQSLAPTGPNYEFSTTKRWRFAAGVGTGTIREVGLNEQLDGNTNMNIRALVTPEVSKAANQVLDVFYEFTIWPDLTDTTGTVDISGTNYNYTVRGAELDDNQGSLSLDAFSGMLFRGSTTAHLACTDDIVAITSRPSSGAGGTPYPSSQSASTAGTGYRDWYFFWDLDNGNDASGIRSLHIRDDFGVTSNLHGFQVRLGKVSDDSKVDKDATKVFDITMRMVFSRH